MRPEIPSELEPRINNIYRLGGYATSSELVRDSVRRRIEDLEDQWFRAGVKNGDGLIDMDNGVTIGTRHNTDEPVRVARWSLKHRNTVTVGITGDERRQLTKQLIEADRDNSDTRFVILDSLDQFSEFTAENGGVSVDYSFTRTSPFDLTVPASDKGEDELRGHFFAHISAVADHLMVLFDLPEETKNGMTLLVCAAYDKKGINHETSTWSNPMPTYRDFYESVEQCLLQDCESYVGEYTDYLPLRHETHISPLEDHIHTLFSHCHQFIVNHGDEIDTSTSQFPENESIICLNVPDDERFTDWQSNAFLAATKWGLAQDEHVVVVVRNADFLWETINGPNMDGLFSWYGSGFAKGLSYHLSLEPRWPVEKPKFLKKFFDSTGMYILHNLGREENKDTVVDGFRLAPGHVEFTEDARSGKGDSQMIDVVLGINGVGRCLVEMPVDDRLAAGRGP